MATLEAPSLYELLLTALDELGQEDIQWFKAYLRDDTLVGDFGVIKRSKLQTEDKTKILEAMMDSYGIFTISIIKRVLMKLNQNHILDELHRNAAPYDPEVMIDKCWRDLQFNLKPAFKFLVESISKSKHKILLEKAFTELYIIKADTGQVNEEHEVRQMETHSWKSGQERTVHCQDIFTMETEDPIRVVLTKGVAGVGKTVLTQKFSLDWAEGTANKDIKLLFPFTFRELNKFRDTEYSLVELLHYCFKQTKALFSFQHLQVLFIFDGLDECRFPLDFSAPVLTEDTESSLGNLLVNLIRGDLLPSGRIWITTRPAAANQIPENCVSIVTEVRGFTDSQKEQYFRKRFNDEQQATAVISHIKSIRSLFIMCHIPVFCWILSDVLHHLLKTNETRELPTTLTQMYVHFLVVQAKVKSKYDGRSITDTPWTSETKEMVWSLGKLAFMQLQKRNLIFYESDLSECGLDAAEIARYSGIFTEVFREEPGQGLEKVYCFIHLSVQEFLAALYVHQTFYNSGENLLFTSHSLNSPVSTEAFYRSAVDQALQSRNGNLDLFLRFLLGLSLQTNHRLLTGLLNHKGSDSNIQGTAQYIKGKLNEEDVSAERTLNLFHCLNELNDRGLLEKIQRYIREGRLSWLKSPAEWAAVSFILLSSESDLEEFDLKKYFPTEEALLGLLPVVKASTKAVLSGCGLSRLCCGRLASVFSSSSLTHLDLSNNDLQDSGVEVLCQGLKGAPCRLETLWLSGCMISEQGGASLASALSSSHLKELDLSYNHPGPSAKLLVALRAPQGPLQMLRLDPAGEQWMVPGLRKYSCEFSLDPNTAHRRVLLSENKRLVTAATEAEEQEYPDHEDRFTAHRQVLSSTGLTGRCYWEVEWGGQWVDIAVSYRGIPRRGSETCLFGYNDQSWSMRVKIGNCCVSHNGINTQLTYSIFSKKVGVFLDSEAGVLSFYEVQLDRRLLHLHTFNAVFTEPLFPGFGLWGGCDVRLV